jgi:hypothetical protein
MTAGIDNIIKENGCDAVNLPSYWFTETKKKKKLSSTRMHTYEFEGKADVLQNVFAEYTKEK